MEIDWMMEQRLSRNKELSSLAGPVLIMGNAYYDNKNYIESMRKNTNGNYVKAKKRVVYCVLTKTPNCQEQDKVGLIQRDCLTRYWEIARNCNNLRNKDTVTVVSFAYVKDISATLDLTVPILVDRSTGSTLHDHFVGDWNRKTFIHPLLKRGMLKKHSTKAFQTIFLDPNESEKQYAKLYNVSFFTNFILETACLPGFLNASLGKVCMPFHPWFLLHLYLFEDDFTSNYKVEFNQRMTQFDTATGPRKNKLHRWQCSIEFGKALCQLGKVQKYTSQRISDVHKSYLRDFQGVDKTKLSSLQWIVCQRLGEGQYDGQIFPPAKTSEGSMDELDGIAKGSNNATTTQTKKLAGRQAKKVSGANDATTTPTNVLAGRLAKKVAKQKIAECIDTEDLSIEDVFTCQNKSIGKKKAKILPTKLNNDEESETNSVKELSVARVTTSDAKNQFELKCSDKLFVKKLVDAVVQPNEVTNFSFNFNDHLSMVVNLQLNDGTLNYTTVVKAKGMETQLVDELAVNRPLENDEKKRKEMTPGKNYLKNKQKRENKKRKRKENQELAKRYQELQQKNAG